MGKRTGKSTSFFLSLLLLWLSCEEEWGRLSLELLPLLLWAEGVEEVGGGAGKLLIQSGKLLLLL